MFRNLPPTTPDLILSLMLRCRQDGRADKIDLSVGVYRTDDGNTPIMAAAREAERQVIAEQTTKVYVGPLGDAAFNAAATDLVLGSGFGATRVCTAQTPGGSGALRMIAELLKAANPEAVIHVPDPTWANHTPLLTSCGLPTTPYAYYDAKTGGVLFDAMLSDLARAKSGDIVLLHGCCHNPTGADLTQPQWAELAVLMLKRGLFPLVDLAYQGLGEGLEQDAAGLRLLAGIVPELAVAFSGSKNFSLYRERIGAAIIMAATPKQSSLALARMGAIARSLYSMPPAHGASIITRVLEDAALRADWLGELNFMRQRMAQLREQLATALLRRSGGRDFSFLTRQRGMFSFLPLSDGQAERLRQDFGLYLLPDGRISIAGLTSGNIERVAQAYCATANERG